MNRLSAIALLFLLTSQASATDADDARQGFELSVQFCARCHVIGEYNRLGGIGNSPSFQWMKVVPDYATRFRTFFSLRPHPTFVRVDGYPKWSNAPSYVPEFEITVEQIELILSYVDTLETPE